MSGISGLSWTIIGQDTSGENIALTGIGVISSTSNWIIRTKANKCFDANGTDIACTWAYEEILPYVYDTSSSVSDFISRVSEPYIIIYNKNPGTLDITITWSTPYSLPTTTVQSTSQKWQSSQIFKFTEDKWKYYDALKYGIYNN